MAGHHIVTPGTYRKVLIGLAVLMFLTIAASYVHLGEPWNLLLAMVIAVTKMLLIMSFFMHLKFSSRLTMVIAGSGFFMCIIMFVLMFADYTTRDWHSTITPYGTFETTTTLQERFLNQATGAVDSTAPAPGDVAPAPHGSAAHSAPAHH